MVESANPHVYVGPHGEGKLDELGGRAAGVSLSLFLLTPPSLDYFLSLSSERKRKGEGELNK